MPLSSDEALPPRPRLVRSCRPVSCSRVLVLSCPCSEPLPRVVSYHRASGPAALAAASSYSCLVHSCFFTSLKPRQQASLVCRPSLLSRFCSFSFCRPFKAALAELLIFLTFCRPFSGLISRSCSPVFVSRFYFLDLFSGPSSPVFLSLKFSGRIFSGFIFPDNFSELFFRVYSSASEFRSSSCRLRFSLRISAMAAHCS